MTTGQLLTIVSDGDNIIQRKLVSVENDMFFVCKPEEFEAASRERREPICIGFKREYILDLGDDNRESGQAKI
jgi:hypothetical protein